MADAGLKIYYIRHAEGGHNVKKEWEERGVPEAEWPVYVGDPDMFTPKGKKQAEAAAGKLGKYDFDFIATSPAWRARNTLLPYLKETGRKAELWPELEEGAGMVHILSTELPEVKDEILNKGKPIELPDDESACFIFREGAENNYRKFPGGGDEFERTSYMKHVTLHAIDLIESRFGGTDKSILLAGHNSSGVSLMKLLLKEAPTGGETKRGLLNTAIWMVEQQEDGSYKLMIAPTPEQKFKRADKDNSGSVSRTEATDLIIADAFAMYDTNADGVVTEAEFVASGGTAANYAKVNAAGDGKVTLAEAQASPLVFNTFAVSFDEADADKNGQVTLAEYKGYLELRNEATQALRKIAVEAGIPPERVICTGDLTAYCAEPRETVDLIREWGIQCIRGNVEAQLAADAGDCGCNFTPDSACDRLSRDWFRFTGREVTREQREWFRTLPDHLRFDLNGISCLVVHGSFRETSRFLFESTPWSEKAAELEAGEATVIIGGHSGLPFSQVEDGRMWCNAGVIGMPANDGTPRAWYALLEPVAGNGLRCTHIPYGYDHEAAADRMWEESLPAEYRESLGSGLWHSCDILPAAETGASGRALAWRKAELFRTA
eukprot:g4072.t1